MQWFRMYAEAVDDEKLRMLAFDDRWHFVALLCLKAGGTLDGDHETLVKRLSIKLGLGEPELTELKTRLFSAKLIRKNWQPTNWEKRQFISDNSTIRVQRHRLKQAGNVTETSPISETAEKRFGNGPDTESEQNRTERPPYPQRGRLSEGRRPREIRSKSSAVWSAATTAIDHVNTTRDLTWAYVTETLADPAADRAIERAGGHRVIADRDKFTRSDLESRFRDAYEQQLQQTQETSA